MTAALPDGASLSSVSETTQYSGAAVIAGSGVLVDNGAVAGTGVLVDTSGTVISVT